MKGLRSETRVRSREPDGGGSEVGRMGGVTLSYRRSEPVCEVGKTRATQSSRACFILSSCYKRRIIITFSKAHQAKAMQFWAKHGHMHIFPHVSGSAASPPPTSPSSTPATQPFVSPSQQWVVELAKESKAKS